MIFNSYWFFYYIAVFFPLYWAVRNSGARKIVLAAGCVIFHIHFAGPAGVFPILLLGVITYSIGLAQNRYALVLGVFLNILSLAFYKYVRFFSEQFVSLISIDAGKSVGLFADSYLPMAPPLAISFFAFEFIHYLYDVWHGTRPIKKPMDFLLFAVFWPSLVAGPIKRYEQYLPALAKGAASVSKSDVAHGMARVAVGFTKKFIADNLTLFVNHYGNIGRFEQITQEDRYVVLAAIAFRILLDFSGYSDMAIGFAKMMGVRLPENFKWPYLATSPADFWHRWHMSLSLWIRDYVYIPLGGNRHGLARKGLNGFFVFVAVGLWHGAAWNFILWGIYHGVGLALTTTFAALMKPDAKIGGMARGYLSAPLQYSRLSGYPKVMYLLQRTHIPFCWGATMIFVWVGWLLFFYPAPVAYKMFTLLIH